MRINKLGLLSLMALLGVIGLISGRDNLVGFFSFAYYIRYFFVTPDELFVLNVRRATSIGFFSGFAASGIAFALRVLLPAVIDVGTVLTIYYVVSVACFTIALAVFEAREQRGY